MQDALCNNKCWLDELYLYVLDAIFLQIGYKNNDLL
jgi:hypothetical protein